MSKFSSTIFVLKFILFFLLLTTISISEVDFTNCLSSFESLSKSKTKDDITNIESIMHGIKIDKQANYESDLKRIEKFENQVKQCPKGNLELAYKIAETASILIDLNVQEKIFWLDTAQKYCNIILKKSNDKTLINRTKKLSQGIAKKKKYINDNKGKTEKIDYNFKDKITSDLFQKLKENKLIRLLKNDEELYEMASKAADSLEIEVFKKLKEMKK